MEQKQSEKLFLKLISSREKRSRFQSKKQRREKAVSYPSSKTTHSRIFHFLIFPSRDSITVWKTKKRARRKTGARRGKKIVWLFHLFPGPIFQFGNIMVTFCLDRRDLLKKKPAGIKRRQRHQIIMCLYGDQIL